MSYTNTLNQPMQIVNFQLYHAYGEIELHLVRFNLY